MPPASQERLIQMVSALSAEQQSAVEAFIRYLQQKTQLGPPTDVHRAFNEFIDEHSELLRRLAQ